MAGVQLILPSDTLSAGFRIKANANFDELIETIQPGVGPLGLPNGTYVLIKFGGGSVTLDLTGQYYTKNQIAQLFSQISSSPYTGAWQNKSYGPQQIVDNNGTLWRSNTTTATEPGVDATWDNILNFTTPPIFSIPAGSARPFIIDMSLYPSVPLTFTPQVEILDAPFAAYTESTPIFDVPVKKVYTDLTHAVLASLSVSGHPSDADDTITQDDIILILK